MKCLDSFSKVYFILFEGKAGLQRRRRRRRRNRQRGEEREERERGEIERGEGEGEKREIFLCLTHFIDSNNGQN